MKDKKALIIGGRGMVGRQLVELCSKIYRKVGVVDKDYNIPKDLPNNVKYYGLDMTYTTHTGIIADYDHIYHLAGIKGSPLRVKERPEDYLPMLQLVLRTKHGNNQCTSWRY